MQDGEDDCRSYYVSEEQIKELLTICKKVFESSELVDRIVTNGYSYQEGKMTEIFQEGEVIKDASVAKELLPYKSGFFFGSTAYDEWYLKGIKDTISILENALREIETAEKSNISIEFEYWASW